MSQDLTQFIPQQKHFMHEYLSMLVHLLPRGPIWGTYINRVVSRVIQDSIAIVGDTNDNIASGTFTQWQDTPQSGTNQISDSLLGIILSAFASELSTIESDCMDLFQQAVPGTATTMLTDWERVLGLPDDGLPLNSKTLEERQAIAHAKFFGEYNIGLNKEFYIDYAEKLGFVITITEDSDFSKPFYVAPVGIDPYNIGSRVGDRLNDSSATSLVVITIVSGPVEHTYLKFIIEQLKPGHVIIKWEE